MSHPVWVRGLKPNYDTPYPNRDLVAPRVGAWIETDVSIKYRGYIQVAPRVGAWIETCLLIFRISGHISRTPCGCVD